MAQLTASFFSKILAIEGGYQNMVSDNGNYCNGELLGTKFGMSAVAVAQWWGRCPTEQEMHDLTEDQARSFYGWYFDQYNLFQVENQQLFELLANNTMGSPANAAKIEQRVLKQLGYNVAVDGQRGPQTIAAINDAWKRYGAKLYNTIRKDWVDYLVSLNRPEFIDGWLNRMNRWFPPIGTMGMSLGIGLLLLYAGYKLLNRA